MSDRSPRVAGEMTRREFLELAGLMAATLALPPRYVDRIATALAAAPRPRLVWLEFQDCAGNTESLLRATQPTVDELLLEVLSLDYHETLMVPAGTAAVEQLAETVARSAGEYVCVVEGSIPTGQGGVYCTIGGRTALEIARQVCTAAGVTIAVGTCATDGGLPAAAPNPTAAVGVADAVPGLSALVNLPGCPVNVANLTATVVHLLTFNELPPTDELARPLFAYGDKIHPRCERKVYHDAAQFVHEWGDEGHRQGWCLRLMGCRGPKTHHNCPTIRWNEGTSWPVAAGHPCIACSEAGFWDRYAPFYVSDRKGEE